MKRNVMEGGVLYWEHSLRRSVERKEEKRQHRGRTAWPCSHLTGHINRHATNKGLCISVNRYI